MRKNIELLFVLNDFLFFLLFIKPIVRFLKKIILFNLVDWNDEIQYSITIFLNKVMILDKIIINWINIENRLRLDRIIILNDCISFTER